MKEGEYPRWIWEGRRWVYRLSPWLAGGWIEPLEHVGGRETYPAVVRGEIVSECPTLQSAQHAVEHFWHAGTGTQPETGRFEERKLCGD